MTISAVIVAGGFGKRMGKKKFSLPVCGHPLIVYTLLPFEQSPLIDEIVLVLPKPDIFASKKTIFRKYRFKKLKKIVPGGKRRQDSVKNGINATHKDCEFVLIHDGARPFITKRVISNVVAGLKKNPAVVPVAPVRDSLRQKTRTGNFSVSREDYYLSQTPQGFYKKMYQIILKKMPRKQDFSDDASIFDKAGVPVYIVNGEERNFKITYPEDIQMGEYFFKKLSKKITQTFKQKKKKGK